MVSNPDRTIKSAHRVLEIIEYFDRSRQYATVMEMSRTLDYPQSSTSELLRCLNRLGYLEYDRTRRAYRPTLRMAVLGAWARPNLFRGGPVLSAIDEIAGALGETVMLSTSVNHVLQHLQVVPGSGDGAIRPDVDDAHILHSPQGLLLLSCHANEELRAALHRLNSEEPDMSRHVRLAELAARCAPLRERGWLIETDRNGVGCVAMLLGCGREQERLVVSVLGTRERIERRGEQILELLLSRKDVMADSAEAEKPQRVELGSVVPLSPPRRTVNYRRHFA